MKVFIDTLFFLAWPYKVSLPKSKHGQISENKLIDHKKYMNCECRSSYNSGILTELKNSLYVAYKCRVVSAPNICVIFIKNNYATKTYLAIMTNRLLLHAKASDRINNTITD